MAASFQDRLLKVTTAALTATLYACTFYTIATYTTLRNGMAMQIKVNWNKYDRPTT